MAKVSTGLGRGLDELFGSSSEREYAQGPVKMVDINDIEPNHTQPRKRFAQEELSALAESIARHGVITPLALRRLEGGRFQIIAGERRYRASRLAGLSELPAIILEADDMRSMELALVENLQREDLNPIEEAEGYRTLIDGLGIGQEEAAARVGRSRPAITNALRLLELCPMVREMLADKRLSAGHGRALAAIKEEKLQLAAAERIIRDELSVRQAEALVKKMKKEPEKKPGDGIDYAAELGKRLSKSLGRGVRVSANSKNTGKILIDFYDLDDLDELVKFLEKR